MDGPTRIAWSRPELIVLVRGGPEEAVLTGCKNGPAVWYANSYHGCDEGPSTDCSGCDIWVVS